LECPSADPDPLLRGLCGLDEAGRGPLAGPVYAAAAILPPGFPIKILDDSKRLTEKRRLEAAREILSSCRWGLGWASPAEIDERNILRASLLAMSRAFAALALDGLAPPPLAVIDGLHAPELPVAARAVVKADAVYPCVMAASILAKVARDREMRRWDWIYPEYGYARHKGYPTAAHRAAVLRLGPSPIQRRTFRVR
jgi:ribonuclease HII